MKYVRVTLDAWIPLDPEVFEDDEAFLDDPEVVRDEFEVFDAQLAESFPGVVILESRSSTPGDGARYDGLECEECRSDVDVRPFDRGGGDISPICGACLGSD